MTEEHDPIQKKKEMFGDGEIDQPKRGGWLRRLLVWLLIVAAAALLVWFFVFVPQTERIADLNSQVSQYEGELATQEAQIADLQSLSPQRDVYSLLADANNARFELYRSRYDNAAAALLSSEDTLDQLESALDSKYAATLEDLRSRLDLAKEDISGKQRTSALSDLEIYINILGELARSLTN